MRYPLALSTCWNSHRHTDGYSMLQEIRDLGFEAAELSHGIRLALLPGILKALEEKWIRVTSLHNFCPLPPTVDFAAPNYFMPTSAYRGERISWVNQTLKTIHFAHDTGANLVVMHMGRVSFFWGSPWDRYEHALQALQGEGTTVGEDDSLKKRREKAAGKLARAQEKVMGRLKECLDQVVPVAQQLGVRLAAENREDPHEVPVDHEGTRFWTEFARGYEIGYWHDAGHARIKEREGLIELKSWLKEVAPQLLGWHLHDVNEEGRDHQVPGTGEIDFSSLSQFYKEGQALTLELSPGTDVAGVQAGAEFIKNLWIPHE